MKRPGFAFLLLIFLGPFLAQARESDAKKERNWTLNGYVKDLASYSIAGDSGIFDNLVHNRLNFKWFPHQNLNIVAEMRNRLFTGWQVQNNPFFTDNLDQADDYFDWSKTFESDNAVVHIMLDRGYVEWTKNDLEVKAGRQRINWGVNLAWNPNDIFNAYSFFDFDYEERPGGDAIDVKYYTGFASSIEVAARMADHIDDFTSAAMWKFNKYKYDFQVLGGIDHQNLVAGGGWAGNIKNAGFKGEGSYFYPLENALDSNQVFVTSISIDYSFKNSLYLNGSMLYNSDGDLSPDPLDIVNYYQGNISAKYLSPYKLSLFLQGTYQFHPLIFGGLSIISFPGSPDFFISPNLSFSLMQNLDLDLISQVVFGAPNDKLTTTGQLHFIRIKWSF